MSKIDYGTLVITMKPGEKILIGDDIEVSLPERDFSTRVKVTAPKSVRVDRQKVTGEIYGKKEKL